MQVCSRPGHSKGLQAAEKLFFEFSSKIPDIKPENYWTRLKTMKKFSQERRIERDRIVQVWSILEGHSPNCGVELVPEDPRVGRMCKSPTRPKLRRHTVTDEGVTVNGVTLFNRLPKTLRTVSFTQHQFENKLDR